MAHFAEIGLNNIVLRVVVINNAELLDENETEQESLGADFCRDLFGGTWVQTSYNGNIRKNFANQGYTYDSERDAFIPPQPYTNWTLNETICQWESPIPYPTDGQAYYWNESSGTWTLSE